MLGLVSEQPTWATQSDLALLNSIATYRYDVEKAFKRLQSHAQWRIDYVPSGRIEEVGLCCKYVAPWHLTRCACL